MSSTRTDATSPCPPLPLGARLRREHRQIARWVHAQGLKILANALAWDAAHDVDAEPRPQPFARAMPLIPATPAPGIPRTGESNPTPPAKPGMMRSSSSTPRGASTCSRSTASPIIPTDLQRSGKFNLPSSVAVVPSSSAFLLDQPPSNTRTRSPRFHKCGASPFPRSVKSQFDTVAAWAPYAHPGAWPDADMLPLGELRPHPDVGPGPRTTRLSPIEQRTMFTLWSMSRSPLILGANLTLLDASTLKLITDRDLIRIDQLASNSRQSWREGDLVVWTADLPGNDRALAVFNLGESSQSPVKLLAEHGLGLRKYRIRDATGAPGTSPLTSSTQIPRHGSLLLLGRASPSH
jgi:hypothetical protein